VLSVDRLWRRYRLASASLRAGRIPLAPPVRWSARANIALRLMQVHLCVIYIFACHSKLQGESWWNGQAIWQAVSNLEYQSVDLTWLAWYPWLVNLLTHATIVWEMTFWALVWRPLCRPIVLLIGVAIHLGIGAFMGMWTFGLAVIFLYVAFVPASTINAVLTTAAGTFGKMSRTFGLDAARITGLRLRALCCALHFDGPVRAAAVVPSAAPLPDDAPLAAPLDPPAIAPSTALETGRVLDRSSEKPRRPVGANDRVAANPGRSLAGFRPVLILVESRLKRQTQIQEYLVKRGFRCFVASELNQARSLLTVVDVDALVVTSTWFSEEEIRSFRDALISGGPSLPASLFFVTGSNRQFAERLEDHDRHRLIRHAVSLRELRLLVLDVLGLPEKESHPGSPRAAQLPNGNGHSSAVPDGPASAANPILDSPTDVEVRQTENGAQI
jgi:hypothetical protein